MMALKPEVHFKSAKSHMPDSKSPDYKQETFSSTTIDLHAIALKKVTNQKFTGCFKAILTSSLTELCPIVAYDNIIFNECDITLHTLFNCDLNLFYRNK